MPDLIVEVLRAALPMLFGWLCAQVPKFLASLIRKDPVSFFCSGGMPSTHTASTMALVTHIAFMEHFRGSTFAIALVFGIVTSFDACNVRLQCGRVAEKTNALLDKVYAADDPDKPEKLSVIKGHTLPEVIVGALIGVAVGVVYTLVERQIFG